MDPTTDIKQKREAMISRVDQQLSHVHEQIRNADEQLASMEARLSRRPREAPRSHPGRPRSRPWLRGIAAFLIAAYIVAAAVVSQSSYGDVVARQAPQLVSALTLPLEKLLLFTQPNPSPVQFVTAEPALAGEIAARGVTPTAVPASPGQATLLQTMARDLANAEREIEQLKASQRQLVSDNARAIEQIKATQEQAAQDIARNAELLKASQEQVAQLVAKASEQNLRAARTSARPQPVPVTRKPAPAPAASHASVRPQTPMQ